MTHDKHRPDIDMEDTEAAAKLFAVDVRKLINSNSIVIDIGANRGQFATSILAISDLKKIYCFEPVPDAYQALEQLSRKFPAIEPVQAAISTQNGTINFYVTKSDVGSSLLKPLSNQPSQWLTVDSQILVKTLRIDDFINSQLECERKTIDLLKSDAQGADLEVLKSAGNMLTPEKIKSVLVEINFTNFYHGQNSYHDVLTLLDRAGYRLARLYPHRAYDDWLWWADALFIGK
jgi:FkbM family methyltransferase